MKMGHTYKLLLVTVLAAHTYALVQSPPRIVKQPPPDELLFQVAVANEVDKPFFIECEAEGEPAPTYKWIKNGKPFDYASYDNRISQQSGRGTLVVTKPRDEDLGQYQCFATNEWGTATSNSVYVRKSELNSFKDERPETKTAQEGDPFKLACQPPDGWPKPNVYWMLQSDLGQIKTINNSRMTLDPEGNLWFSNVTRNDASSDYTYTCAAKSLFRNEYKLGNKVYLKVAQTGISPGQNRHEPVQQYVTRRNEVALKGKSAEIYCIFGGTPLPQTVWKKNGNTLLSSDRIQQGNYGKSLFFKAIEYEDEASYTCEVSNGVGSAKTYSVNLKVNAIPFFKVEPEEVRASEGEEARIECAAEGYPEPSIKWIYNGRPIEEAPPNERRTVGDNAIVIRDLVKKDTGNYGCNATNNLGYVYKDVFINVQAIPPEIQEPPRDIVTAETTTAIMRCRVFGAPKPIVKWLRDNVELTGGRYNITPQGDLVIKDVGFQDVGAYQCYAQNKFGVKDAFGSLQVKKHTVITDRPEDYEVAAGTEATFRCNAVADDSLNLEIIWLQDGKPIDHDSDPRKKMTNDYSLLITKTTELDSGEYTCVAKTEIDEARAQAILTVQDVPNAPSLLGIDCHSMDAMLRWRPEGDNRAPILRYQIQYNTSFTPDTWEVAFDSVPNIDMSYNVPLTPWANYTFRVIAFNKIGPSVPSGHSDVCTTTADVPHKNPDNVEGKGTEPTNMIISWSPMRQIEHNGPNFHYRVHWRRNIDGAQFTTEEIRDWRKHELLITNQPTFQPYKIKVVAVNAKGESNVQPIEVTGWSGEDTPTQAPTNFTLVAVTGPKYAHLRWNPVDPATVRGHFKGYKIQTWTDAGGIDKMKEFPVEPNAKETLLNELVPYSKNYARILVYNGRYNGIPSETLAFVTPEGTPGSVRTFEAHPIGSSAMLLKWEPPKEPNGVLTGYKVYYQEVKGTALDQPKQERKPNIEAKFDRAKLAGLKPNTKYRIWIHALTKVGEGDGYFVEQTTRSGAAVLPDVPIFDTELLPTKDNLVPVLVRWRPSLDGHSGTHFIAKYRIKGEPKFLETPPEMSEDWLVIPGLEPNQQYEIRVAAFDGDYFRESESRVIETTYNGPEILPRDNVATAGWFIGVMLALAFLLLILILVCIVRRNRGGKYDVHDRELAHGRRDYPEGGFHEYTHPLDTKSRHSMGSAKPGPESDTDSMAEYGEGETAGMNEDGSFIGQYGRRRRAPPGQPDSASGAFATLV